METLAVKTGLNLASFSFIIPEIIIASALLIILLLGMIRKNKGAELYFILAALALIASIVFAMDNLFASNSSINVFVGMLQIDTYSSLLKIFCSIAALLTIVMFGLEKKSLTKPSEQSALLLSIVLGAQLLLSSMNFIMLVVSIELLSISSYLLVGLGFTKKSAEGSLKYFLYGAAATAIMIYGASWLYGMGGTLEFASEHFIQNMIGQPALLYLIAGSMLMVGLLFKIAAVPFHIWAPDVYYSANTPVVALLSTVPKIAGLGILLKIYYALNLYGQSPVNWQILLILVASLSIGFGNFAALRQTEAKRLMAWSSIAHSGFMLIGIISNSVNGIEAMLFYMGIYILSNFIVFGIIQYNEQVQGNTSIAGFDGLGKTKPFLAIVMTIGLLALTGLPPTAGFTAKLLLFSQVFQGWAQSQNSGLLFLLIFGLINTVPALYYYLRIPYFMFFKTSAIAVEVKFPFWYNYYYITLFLLILWLFFQPDMLMSWINRTNFAL